MSRLVHSSRLMVVCMLCMQAAFVVINQAVDQRKQCRKAQENKVVHSHHFTRAQKWYPMDGQGKFVTQSVEQLYVVLSKSAYTSHAPQQRHSSPESPPTTIQIDTCSWLSATIDESCLVFTYVLEHSSQYLVFPEQRLTATALHIPAVIAQSSVKFSQPVFSVILFSSLKATSAANVQEVILI